MFDTEAFLTKLYVMCGNFCQQYRPAPPPGSGARPSLCPGKVLRLSLLWQWGRFEGQRGFYCFTHKHLRALFPCLPDVAQFNRLLRAAHADLQALLVHLGQ